jgi:DNA polymerase-3 subunit gamma/tau
MSYLVYARKYRPKTFEEMIGQKHVVQTLQNAIKNNRVAQAYLFSGMRGIGKTTAARILAKALNCTAQDGPTPAPCNKCDSCQQIDSDRSVDVLEVDGASTRKIETIDPIRETAKYRAINSRYKIIIIDEVHMLSSTSFNALLKILEEPPPSTIFIFATTEFHKLPATIVSRCQHFEFKKITHKDLINHMLYMTKKEKIIISDLGLSLIADAAGGSMRDAQSLLDQAVAFSGDSISDEDLKEILGTISSELLFQFSEAILTEKTEQIFILVEKIMERGYDLRKFFKELIKHFRILLVIKSSQKPGDILGLNERDLKLYAEGAKDSSAEDILRYLTAMQQSEQGLRYSSHPQIYLETTLVGLCFFKKMVPLKDILKRMNELGKAFGKSYSRSHFSPDSRKKNNPPQMSISENKAEEKPKIERKKEREIDKALEDPGVKKFMDTFKAQVISAEPIKKSDKKGEK